MEHPGLRVCRDMPWLGGSPDGILTTPDGHRGVLEIKCPYGRQLYPSVPEHYWCQVQLCMFLFECDFTHFVVMTPDVTEVTRIEYDSQFVENRLLPGIHDFFFNMYLPSLLRLERGELAEGSVCPAMDVCLDFPLHLSNVCNSDSDSDSAGPDE